jgi:hypothetical protein
MKVRQILDDRRDRPHALSQTDRRKRKLNRMAQGLPKDMAWAHT